MIIVKESKIKEELVVKYVKEYTGQNLTFKVNEWNTESVITIGTIQFTMKIKELQDIIIVSTSKNENSTYILSDIFVNRYNHLMNNKYKKQLRDCRYY